MEGQDVIQYKWQRMKHQIQGFLAFKSGSPSCIVMGKKLRKNIISFLALSTIDLTPDHTKIKESIHSWTLCSPTQIRTCHHHALCLAQNFMSFHIQHALRGINSIQNHPFQENSFLPFLSAELLYLFISFWSLSAACDHMR